MKITVFGTGYVGLVTAACFAQVGNHVTCVDIKKERIANFNRGIIPIYEPGLDVMVQENKKQGRLNFTTEVAIPIQQAEIIFIAVGTPSKSDGAADLQYVLSVAETIAKHASDFKIIVNKSTVPVGTADLVKTFIDEILLKEQRKLDFAIVSNPEFLKEGTAINDCMKPDRIIIGSNNSNAIETLKLLYAPFARNHDKFMIMDVRSAEMTKYVANAMLATKISFMNEMSQIAERFGADIELIRQGIGSDKRIGYDFIYPGCGYGGSCFPKDVKALLSAAEQNNYYPQILSAVHKVNEVQKQWLFKKIYSYFEQDINNKTIAIWGLAFKPNTDDIRDAPALILIEQLWKFGAKVKLYDPKAMENFKKFYGERNDYELVDSQEDAVFGADALAILTEWECFRTLDITLVKKQLKTPVIFDGRNLYNQKNLEQIGIDYFAVGRCARLQKETLES